MVFALVTKKFRAWRIARNTRGQEFKPPQFSQGHRVGKLRYYTEGDENSQFTLVFVHGYTLAAQAWHVQVAAFADQVRCIAMDLRGHGKSDPVPASECNIPDAADDVMAVLDDAGVTTPIILVGHSLGTMVVLNFLRRYPQFRLRCRGVVLVSASAQPFASACCGGKTRGRAGVTVGGHQCGGAGGDGSCGIGPRGRHAETTHQAYRRHPVGDDHRLPG